VFAYPAPLDLRKGHDGLYCLLEAVIGRDPGGDLFLSVSASRNLDHNDLGCIRLLAWLSLMILPPRAVWVSAQRQGVDAASKELAGATRAPADDSYALYLARRLERAGAQMGSEEKGCFTK
jgi:hypothetical protein